MSRKELNELLEKLDWGSYEILSDEDGYIRILVSVDEDGEEESCN